MLLARSVCSIIAAALAAGALIAEFPPSTSSLAAERARIEPLRLPDADIAAIRNAILKQIEAFGRDDAETAFSFASPGIRKLFGTPEIFLHMVRKTYPSVYRPDRFGFRPLQLINDKIVQPVAIVGPTGVPETALYIMERQPDGVWKIGACIMAREPGEDT